MTLTEPLRVELDNTVYALDSSTIDLCLSLFDWAPFRSTKAANKLHTLLDLRGAKVEHVFAVIRLKFGFTTVRYRGLDKNAHRLFVTCALANLFLARRPLLRPQLVGA